MSARGVQTKRVLEALQNSVEAKSLFGEAAGAGWTGHTHFEPNPGADVGVATSNFPGDYVGTYGGYTTDYTNDLERRMTMHRGSIVDAQLNPDSADPKVKGYLDEANKKLDMPGILSFP
ncbi:hypothetical protein GUITHDRAFT_155658 [Guillardia theta CCMP2712]|uniref:Uncharacterized protein n=1 Tax=Guillardia theta (strain CCMP2712) TaxID=905079 RepID=L1IF37_GUITC|nr:hypothetical protein GUITHDRAFT_155658 [Guillardia theta CCMP2712]EKX34697.1 hypothetical protein GUITHDRAFT_155658 [Guillardia theta CCMP2712]|mmetsp:Transcript_30383/g.97872  ORF Transcript_30383/g.97872 Transcript_30383/m.97872 type:complete len:119 (+) Transcript_30383:80-436(+)|eukprot:XP_005821677.1 hypothetical protein GUITHDRAFT_155658 [Guillardia theta CCMP2712]